MSMRLHVSRITVAAAAATIGLGGLVGAVGERGAVIPAELKAFAHKKVLITLTEDGKALARPRLVVPGDKHGARQVYDVASISLLRLSTILNKGTAGSQDPKAGGTHTGH